MNRHELGEKLIEDSNLCGRYGHLVATCSFLRGGCGYRFGRGQLEITYCPLCGLDRLCRADVTGGKSACRQHGGSSTGIRRSSSALTREDALPKRMRAAYESSVGDPGLMDLARDLALSETLIKENLLRLDVGDPGEKWLEFRQLWRDRKRFLREAAKTTRGDKRWDELMSKISEVESDIDDMVELGADEWLAINKDIPAQLELRRRLVLTEYTRLEKLQFMVHIEKFMNFSDMLATAVLQHADEDAQRKIFNVMQQFLEKGNYKSVHGRPDYRLIEGAIVDG